MKRLAFAVHNTWIRLKLEACSLKPSSSILPIVVCLTALVLTSNAQSLEIIRVEQQGKLMNIYYDLVDATTANQYTVQLYSSHDQFTSPLKNVTGDIGEKMSPGRNKKVIFDMTAEYGDDFSNQGEAKISFEIRGELFAPLLVANKQFTKLKKGKTYTIEWKVRPGTERLTAELMRGDDVVLAMSSVGLDQCTITVPTGIHAGKHYRLRVSDPANPNHVYLSGEFAIVRKVPLVVYAVPVIAIPLIIMGWPQAGPEEPQSLPDPLKPD